MAQEILPLRNPPAVAGRGSKKARFPGTLLPRRAGELSRPISRRALVARAAGAAGLALAGPAALAACGPLQRGAPENRPAGSALAGEVTVMGTASPAGPAETR